MRAVLLAIALLAPLPALTDEAPVLHGADGYAAAPVLTLRTGAPGDLFAAGARVRIAASSGGDVHAAGFAVAVEAETEGDLYAAGADIDLSGPVGGDANLIGGAVATGGAAVIDGNARLSGGSVRVGGAVRGDALVAGGEVVLAAPIAGDLRVTAGALTFEGAASVGGLLIYTTPEPVAIPATVADPARVRFVPAEPGAERDEPFAWKDVGAAPAPWAMAGGVLVTIAFLILLGAILLALVPRKVAAMRRAAHGRPGTTMLLGLAGLSTLVGLVFVAAMSIVGLPLVPIVVLAIMLVWLLGYLLGAYVLAMAVARGLGMGAAPRIWARIGVLAVAVIGAALLNFIPVLGWMANLALVLLGVGAFTGAALAALAPRIGGGSGADMRGPVPDA
jgi:hypothetical protein